ncbi:MAG: hypothetical protein K6G63_03455 [Eubacterium sp.]|nr:hypothetical protein [Eubacterium sp.]
MKLKYKKLIILLTVGAIFLCFIILALIPTGTNKQKAVDVAKLDECDDDAINTLINNYFQAKRDVDMEKMAELVSDINQINQEKLVAKAEYVEDYKNIKSYIIKNPDNGDMRIYVRYDMKLKNIDTLGPCLCGLYVTMGSDERYIIYLSALDEAEESFILAADENENVVRMKEEVTNKLQEAISKDSAFKQLYERMDKDNQSIVDNGATTAPATVQPTNTPVQPTAAVTPVASAPAQTAPQATAQAAASTPVATAK